MKLKPEEEAALIESLGELDRLHRNAKNDGDYWREASERFREAVEDMWPRISAALHDLAAERKRSGELERAQELLREWREKAGGDSETHAGLSWSPYRSRWLVSFVWFDDGGEMRDVDSCDVGDFDSPVTAVIEASKQTPWPVGTEG